MKKTFCDRCDAETTSVPSSHVRGIEDADEDGDGDVSRTADLCTACYALWLAWLDYKPTKRGRRAPAAATGHQQGGHGV